MRLDLEVARPMCELLTRELGVPAEAADLAVASALKAPEAVSLLVSFAGAREGRAVFNLSRDTALALASRVNGCAFTALDEAVKGTLSSVAASLVEWVFEAAGTPCDVSPPTLVAGAASLTSGGRDSHGTGRLVLPFGSLWFNLAFQDGDELVLGEP